MKSILIVEDNHDIRDLMEILLRQGGYNVFLAENGKKAIEILENIHVPDLILLDIEMPVMSGLDFLKATKSNPKFAGIPVIILSAAKAGEVDLIEEIIHKPFNIEDLLASISKILDHKA